MSSIKFYKGVHKVKIVTESVGYLIIEAMEDFKDTVDGKIVAVKKGDTRIVPAETVYKKKTLPPLIKEHTYELEMEKKLKKFIAEKEKKNLGD